MTSNEGEISVNFKVSTGKKFKLSIHPSATVLETKQKAETEAEVPASQQKLIYRGRILKDTETLANHSIANDHTIHLVRSGGVPPATTAQITTATPGTTPSSAPVNTTTPLPGASPFGGSPPAGMPGLEGLLGSLGGAEGLGNLEGLGTMGTAGGMPGGMNPNMFQSLMTNPAVQSMMQEVMRNPDMLRNVLQSNPMLNQMASSTPMLQSLLSNPDMLSSMMTPEVINQAIGIQQTLANQNPPTAGTTTTTATGLDGTTTSERTTTTTTNTTSQPNPFGGTAPFNQGQGFQTAMNQMMANPELMRQVQSMAASMGLGNANAFNTPGGSFGANSNANMSDIFNQIMGGGTPGATGTPLTADRLQTELQQLREMGFIDNDANLRALQLNGGDVNQAIAWLLNNGLGN